VLANAVVNWVCFLFFYERLRCFYLLVFGCLSEESWKSWLVFNFLLLFGSILLVVVLLANSTSNVVLFNQGHTTRCGHSVILLYFHRVDTGCKMRWTVWLRTHLLLNAKHPEDDIVTILLFETAKWTKFIRTDSESTN